MKFIISPIFAFSISIAVAFTAANASAQSVYYPPTNSDEWEQIDPSELNWCADSIDAFYDWLEEKNSKAFLVLQDGKIVLERYFGTFQPDSIWLWASAGKTLTSFMIGQAQAEGQLAIDDPMADYLGRGWTDLTPEREDSIKIIHGLTMTSGLDDSIDPFCTDPECLQYLTPPGTRWAYHNGPYTSLLGVLENAYNLGINLLTNQLLKRDTGMDGFWLSLGFNRIYFSTARSMARFGWLIANYGKWENKTLLDDMDYLEAMRKPSQNLNPSYGYLWWLNGEDAHMLPVDRTRYSGPLAPEAPNDAYFAIGALSQIIAIHPATNRVIVRMGLEPNDSSGLAPTEFLREMHERMESLSCSTVGVSNPEASIFEVYPNPALDELRWRSKTPLRRIQIFHASGATYSYSASELESTSLNIRNLPAGLYHFRALTLEGQILSTSFVKGR
ncbi:MAG: serine hydrolase [Bacteroidetes bacterium]|jgi:CubicO group peptidase (beta-lactamase class C family)|nr:serine hydrolase [Bacteroidota bacterium]